MVRAAKSTDRAKANFRRGRAPAQRANQSRTRGGRLLSPEDSKAGQAFPPEPFDLPRPRVGRKEEPFGSVKAPRFSTAGASLRRRRDRCQRDIGKNLRDRAAETRNIDREICPTKTASYIERTAGRRAAVTQPDANLGRSSTRGGPPLDSRHRRGRSVPGALSQRSRLCVTSSCSVCCSQSGS